MVHNFASTNGRPVESPIGVLDQSHGERAIAIRRVEVVHRGKTAGWSDLEEGSSASSPAVGGGPVEVSIAGLDRRRARIAAVRVAKDVQGGKCTRRSHFEDRAT